MRLRHAAELGFPVAVQHYPVEMAAARIRFPLIRFGGIEANVLGGADGLLPRKRFSDV